MLDLADEHWHSPTKHLHWNESFYFNFFDDTTGWACAARVGATPNAGERDGFICLYLPDQTTGFIRVAEPIGLLGDEIQAAGIQFRCVEPFRNWHIHYDGPILHFSEPASDADLRRTLAADRPSKHLKLDLQVEAAHPPFDYDERSVRLRPFNESARRSARRTPLQTLQRTCHALLALPSMMGAHHYEQSGTVRGILELDGARTKIDGRGQRDHSWGVRDMRAPASWRWLSCQFGAELCFNATQVDLLGMRVQGGFVAHGGTAEALESWRYEPTYGSSAFWPDSLGVVLTAKSGYQFALEAEVVSPLPVVAKTEREDVLVTAARAKYVWGERVAHGMVEFMEQLS
jgi:hypothetical protein